MYTVLTTCPPYGSRNVGDELIEIRTKEIINQEKGEDDFFTLFREEPLEPHLDTINRSRAVLMPAFPVRDTPMYPGTYRLTDDLSKIKVPLIPIGANWNVYPGDEVSRISTVYSEKTAAFLKHVASGVKQFSCREYYAAEVLRRHGIENTFFTGDPAWFHLPSIGKPLRRSRNIRKVVFSPPLSPFYVDQAEDILAMIARMFPDAERFCTMHLRDSGPGPDPEREKQKKENSAAMSPEVAKKNEKIRTAAGNLGFSVVEAAGDVRNLDFYEECDLHVGYECHAHLFFFSRRIPSILIAEDARGVGFNYTLGYGGFSGFIRSQTGPKKTVKKHTSGYCTSLSELCEAPPKLNMAGEIQNFLAEEAESGFMRFLGLGRYIDTVYQECMAPFIRELP
ncbi:MAG: polysaccharide pyruvyl transferase family protein [Spirochaetia bacterium]